MKSFIISFFVVSISCLAGATSYDDVLMFLPFLKSYQPPPPCPPNEMYKMCMNQCSSCSQRGMCFVTECTEGCECAPRFFRVTPDGPCVPVANCPIPTCGENEIFRECGPICERCTTMSCQAINCDHKCYCKEGYLRNSDEVCIPANECPIRQQCTHSEQWAESGLVNEFCQRGENESFNETQNVAQCYCKEGFKRNSLGYCVKEEFCTLIRCPGKEIFHECIPKCNTTCRNYGDLNCTEDDNCYGGCFCPPGHVMNDFRACIPVENCSLDIQQLKIVESSLILIEEDESDDSENATQTTATESAYMSTKAYPGTDEDTVKESEITSTEPPADTSDSMEQSDVLTTKSPSPSSHDSEKAPKRKSGKMRPSKHANAARFGKASKQGLPNDDTDFDNEEI